MSIVMKTNDSKLNPCLNRTRIRPLVLVVQLVVLSLGMASRTMAGNATANDIDIRIGFENRNPNVEYGGWTACTDMEGGNAGDEGSEVHLALAPRDYHLAIEYYENDGPCALRSIYSIKGKSG